MNPLITHLKAAGLSHPGSSCLVRSITALVDRAEIERRRQELDKEIAKLRRQIKYRDRELRMELLFNEQRIAALRIQHDLDDPDQLAVRTLESANATLRMELHDLASEVDDSHPTAARFSRRTLAQTAIASPGLWQDMAAYTKRLDAAKVRAEQRLARRGSKSGRAGRIREIMADTDYPQNLRSIVDGLKQYELILKQEERR